MNAQKLWNWVRPTVATISVVLMMLFGSGTITLDLHSGDNMPVRCSALSPDSSPPDPDLM